ncbi:PspC domain-containing protein [Mucilaginibacter sp. ZT4R22]|uniref:PspC domain-containing protein n=1 Tax=Mucilaginibacter pankratovii TaxID=2772110 RepID=A0ABR7WMX0_9SPHI|nr:PspC domain-containing protein [Mucilaginibacter pankratovii]MBD1363640.1 PspC domain-containing protein [Mucilaginibacter pankratovii]
MNKTIIININGTVFHIEEDAYEILKTYMTAVTRHFMNSADSLEITTDIENRIAEMFTEILTREGKQVVVAQDVNAVVGQMGSVEDFEAEENGERPGQTYTYTTENRRLFRDADDHLVGGVAAGISNYFDINAIWVRLGFLLLCAGGGIGFLLYIILWIVVPKAVTRADRMAMKGQKLDLHGFKLNFEEELSTVKGNLNTLRHEAKPLAYKTRDFAGDIFGHFGNFITGASKLIFKLVAIAILLACFAAMIGLVITIVMFTVYGNTTLTHVFPFNIVNQEANTMFLVCGFLTLAMPLLAIILVIINAVFKSSTIGRTTGSALLMVWVVAISIVIYYTAKAGANFREGASFSQSINIKPQADSTYYLKLNDIKFLSREDSVRLQIKDKFDGRIILDDDDDNNMDMPNKNIDIYIEKSDVSQPVLVESFSARGRDYEDALSNARGISYQFQQVGNVLKFNRRMEKQEDKFWRAQELHLTLKVPMNYKLVIDQNLDRFVRGISVYDCKNDNKQEAATSAKFIMTENGLQCKIDTLVLPQPKKVAIPADSTQIGE